MSARPVFDLVRERYLEIAEGCRLADSHREFRYPTPLDVSGQDLVHVGRIRRDLTDENGLVFWCCGDQLRKGAATNAVQIAELLFGRTRPPQIPDPETGPVRRDAGSGRRVFRRAGESGGTS